MNLESLANELLLDIFDYFNSIELLRSFYGLNNHFNELLYRYFQTHSIDFRSVAKKDFQFVCEKIFPSIFNRIYAIKFSNNEDTPNQLQTFFSFGYRLSQLTYLQSLFLSDIRAIDIICAVLVECRQLTDLQLKKISFSDETLPMSELIETIWTLPNLRCCTLEISPLKVAKNLRSTSTSLRSLTIEHSSSNFADVLHLFEHTPNIEFLQLSIRDRSDTDRIFLSNFSLRRLHLSFQGSIDLLQRLLRGLPNLIELKIETNSIFIDGNRWKEILHEKLQRFELLMTFEMKLDENIDLVLQSFQTEFWLQQRRWFVQCNTNSEDQTTILYTIPYAFTTFRKWKCNLSKSTCETKFPLTRVKTLIVNNDLLTFAKENSIRFPSVAHLELFYPFDETFWTVLPKFDRLVSLELMSAFHSDETDRSLDQLVQLLDRAEHLYSLTVDCLILSQVSSIVINNRSIRRLDLITNDGHFYGSECLTWIETLVADRCEILSINVEHRTLVLEILKKFPRLRALIIQCQDDQWGEDSHDSSMIDDEIILWFQSNLSSNHSILRDESEPALIQLWIG